MAAGKARPIAPVLIDDNVLERIANIFVARDVYNRLGLPFEVYLRYVAAGKCHYYVDCRRG